MTVIGPPVSVFQLANPREAAAAAPVLRQGASEGPDGLTDEDRERVQVLRETDREVRAHEEAHSRAGGPYASSPTFEYVRGPDGKRYAVSGEVQIDTSPIAGNPAATIRKMVTVVRAARAPAEPSAQDRKVAAQARAEKAEAQIELRQQEQEEAAGGEPSPLEQARDPDAAARKQAAAQYGALAKKTGAAFSLAV